MTAGFDGGPALVPGQLQGFRRFRLKTQGLYPMVVSSGAWSAGGQTAACYAGATPPHPAPDSGCRCGLYGWYDPADDAQHGWLTGVPAVIAASGRVILGDSGFRAEHARITAVALPWQLRTRPAARRRATAMLARVYPDVTVYPTRRRMLTAHPAEDLAGLGITPRPSPSRHRLRQARLPLLAAAALLLALPWTTAAASGTLGASALQLAVVLLVSRGLTRQLTHTRRSPQQPPHTTAPHGPPEHNTSTPG